MVGGEWDTLLVLGLFYNASSFFLFIRLHYDLFFIYITQYLSIYHLHIFNL